MLNPTAWQVSEIASTGCDGEKSSITDGAPHASACGSPNRCRAIVDFPLPDGPTMSPTFQSAASIGTSTRQRSEHFSCAGTSNIADTWRARTDVEIADSTTRSTAGT